MVMEGVWLFILGVNFWNIFGAGVFGSVVSLPIVNYSRAWTLPHR